MPIFEYECNSCGVATDLIRTYDKRQEPGICPECGGKLEFVDRIQRTGFKLKGTGWYETDFKTRS